MSRRYTSSTISNTLRSCLLLCASSRAASPESSPPSSTWPLGLHGEFTRTAAVCAESALLMASRSRRRSGPVATGTNRADAVSQYRRNSGKYGAMPMTSSPGSTNVRIAIAIAAAAPGVIAIESLVIPGELNVLGRALACVRVAEVGHVAETADEALAARRGKRLHNALRCLQRLTDRKVGDGLLAVDGAKPLALHEHAPDPAAVLELRPRPSGDRHVRRCWSCRKRRRCAS